MARLHVLLLIPPLTQLNTPYPSTAYLTGFLRSQDIRCTQADIGIEMVLKLFSRSGLESVFEEVQKQNGSLPPQARTMLTNKRRYGNVIEPIVEFLQGKNPALAKDLIRPGVIPRGPRFKGRGRLSPSVSLEDRAKQWATFCLEDLADLVQATVSRHFALSRYAEHIARSASAFDPLLSALEEPPNLTDRLMLEALRAHVDRAQPHLIGISVPFPGNVYGAFRMAQAIKQYRPDIPIALGGGYVNTELRRLNDPRVFDYVDFVTLDDGERPILSLVEHVQGRRPRAALCRTFYAEKGRVNFANGSGSFNFSMDEIGCPTYAGLKLDRYLTILDCTNPMHRLWSEGHWNKLTVAHGCYWRQCTFCDVGLDYIGRYETTSTDRLLSQIQQLIQETGMRGFHFVDEAAPPAALKALALGLLERKSNIRWWGNIRFESAFSKDLCRLLSSSGCIAVTAGLEAASDRLLEKMKKGITVDQTALVASAFREAGILIHAYLMYGFPSETIQETIDSLERVRQLFAAGLMQSAFWHRFTATTHSPIGLKPRSHGIRILGPKFEGFADNDLIHTDSLGETPDWLGEGLRRSMLNFLEGRGMTMHVQGWFDHPVPEPRVPATWVTTLLKNQMDHDDETVERRLVWIGQAPMCTEVAKRAQLVIPGNTSDTKITLPRTQARWLYDLIRSVTPERTRNVPYPLLREAGDGFPGRRDEFSIFLETPVWRKVRAAGLLLV
ncbi:MAG TPA: radical SAM protein [Nitrospira sp.]